MILYELFSNWIEWANTTGGDVFLNTFFEHFLSYLGCTLFANRFFAVLHKISALMRTALFRVIAQRVMVIPYRHFGTTYRYRLQGSSSSPLKMGCPETSVRNYHHSLRNSSHEGNSHLLRGANLKSRISLDVYSRKYKCVIWTGNLLLEGKWSLLLSLTTKSINDLLVLIN